MPWGELSLLVFILFLLKTENQQTYPVRSELAGLFFNNDLI